DAAEDGGRGFAGNGLVRDGFDQHFVRGFGGAFFDAKFLRFLYKRSKQGILRRQRIHGQAQVKRRHFVFCGYHEAPFRKRANRLANWSRETRNSKIAMRRPKCTRLKTRRYNGSVEVMVWRETVRSRRAFRRE